jgi:hypothetical protein
MTGVLYLVLSVLMSVCPVASARGKKETAPLTAQGERYVPIRVSTAW